jgi:anaerobic magnesium-protoporphyrin IX monomethyl ester cyclase
MKTNTAKNVLYIILPYLSDCGYFKNAKMGSFKVLPYGVLSVATYLKNRAKDKVNMQILDCNLYGKKDFISAIKKKLKEFEPDVVGLSIMFDSSYKYLADISTIVKKHDKNIITVLGGGAASLSYPVILKEQKDIDGVCFYDGEIPFLKLIESENMLDFLENDISWITKKTLKEGKIPQKTSVQNLDDVINIDYGLVHISNYAMREAFSPFTDKIKSRRQFFIVTSRGCPFNCAFCMHSADKDKSIRYASVKEVLKHVKFLISKYKMNVLTIYDDQILLNKERARELFRELAKFNLRIECPNGLPPAFMDEEIIKLMKKAGMDTVYLAIESASPHVLNNVIHKPLKLEMVESVVKILRKYGFWIQGSFVSGLPGEENKHRDEAVKFIKKVGLDWSCFTLAIPMRGTELFKTCVEKGYIKKDMKIDELGVIRGFIINTPQYSAKYVTRVTYLMNLDVNFVNNYRMRNGEYGIAANIFRDVIKRYQNHAFAYFYLAKALHELDKNDKRIKPMLGKMSSIIKKDVIWKEYFEHFGIDFSSESTKLISNK